METLMIVWTILKVALGISFVIFWHELGHFALAKWNGVHVKTFSIGFPPTMARLFRYKETDYVIGWIPLGGYVRMVGDEEGESRDPNSPEANDPGAYHNKSVWARMAIISAGVVLNVFLGWVCYVAVFKMGGLEDTPATLGVVSAGGPAYVAGMRTGDEIISIDGKTEPMFSDLKKIVAHSVDDQRVEFVVRRPGAPEHLTFSIEPTRDPVQDVPTIRVGYTVKLSLAKPPFDPPPGMEGKPTPAFEEGDKIVRITPEGGEPIEVVTQYDLDRVLGRYRDTALQFVVARPDGPAPLPPSGGARLESATAQKTEEVSITVPPNLFVDLGFAPTMGKIVALRDGSPAEKAGFRVGDRIVAVSGQAVTNPMTLSSQLHDAIGKELQVEIRRPKPGDEEDTLTLAVTPVDGFPWTPRSSDDEPLNLDCLGAAVEIKPVVGWVRPGSAAEKAALKPGDVVEGLTLTRPIDLSVGRKAAEPIEVEFGPLKSYNAAFSLLQALPAAEVPLRIKGRKEPVKLRPEPVAGWYNPDRGLVLMTLTRELPPLGLAEAVQRGTSETVEAIGLMYRILQSLAQRRVGTSNIAGPIRIAGAAYTIAGRSLVEFMMFIGMISLNLAVVNFLPIPPLDGGKMVFLIGEAVRGRPLPESWQIAFSNVGVIFVLGLMVFVVFQDVLLTFFR